MLQESEAYTHPYHVRASATYAPGAIVTVGPAYRMGGTYENDGWEGTYTVIRRCGPPGSPDYYLRRGVHTDLDHSDWHGIVHAARLEPAACPECGARAETRTCDGCGRSAVVIDCGHQAQPQPIAAGRADGSDLHHTYCTDCA